MPVEFRIDGFWAFDVTVRNLQRQILRRIPGESAAVGIELRLIEILTVFIWLASGKNAAFNFYIAPYKSSRGDPESDVR